MQIIQSPNDSSFAAKTASYTGTAGTVTAWPVGPRAVWVFCTTQAYVRVGVGVTATTADFPVPANFPVILAVPDQNAPWVVSAIQAAAGGSVYAKPVNGNDI
jgi:hypothetical protein